MDNNRSEIKVGLFIVIGMVLIALLMLNFSKGVTLFQKTYRVYLVMPSVSGLRPKSSVMMAGVPVGTVNATDLSPSGTNVTITLKLLSKYRIHKDANFHVDSFGFLGDQYVAITPTRNEGDVLKDGDIVIGHPPFNLQETVRSTAGLLDQARQTLASLDQAITNVNRTILSQQTLTNFGNAISNFHAVTANALKSSAALDEMLSANSRPISVTVTNMEEVSRKLNTMADALNETIETNRADVTGTIKDLHDMASNLRQISSDLQAGKGLAGTLLKDDKLKAQTEDLIGNMNALAASLAEFSSNLNEKGLWTMMWKPKHSKPAPAPGKTGK